MSGPEKFLLILEQRSQIDTGIFSTWTAEVFSDIIEQYDNIEHYKGVPLGT